MTFTRTFSNCFLYNINTYAGIFTLSGILNKPDELLVAASCIETSSSETIELFRLALELSAIELESSVN